MENMTSGDYMDQVIPTVRKMILPDMISVNLSAEGGNFQLIEEEKLFPVIAYLHMLIAFFGMIGNFVAISTIIRLREYRKTVANLYILQLLVANLLFMFALAFEGFQALHGGSTIICKLFQTARMLSYYSSVFFLTIMAVDRYLAINHSFVAWAVTFRNRRSVYIISTLTWLLCLPLVANVFIQSELVGSVCVPMSTAFATTEVHHQALEEAVLLSASESSGDFMIDDNETSNDDYAAAEYQQFNKFEEENTSCHLPDTGVITSVIMRFIAAFILPLAIISCCYVGIAKTFSKGFDFGSGQHKLLSTRKRVTVVVLMMVVTFVVCWIPYHIFMLSLINGIPLQIERCLLVKHICAIFAYTSSVIHPILYITFGADYKNKLGDANREILCEKNGSMW